MSERRIVVAPAAADRIALIRAWLRSRPADAEVLIVGPNWEACDDLVRGLALETGALFGVLRLTLARLAGHLAAPALAATGRVPADGLALDAVVARAVHHLAAEGRLTYFGAVAGRPGFPRAARRTIEELRMNGMRPAALARLEAVGGDLAALSQQVERELGEGALADRAAVYEAAAEAARAASPPHPVGLPLVLLDLAVETRHEAALIAALAAQAPSVLTTVPAGDERSLVVLEHALACRREPPADRAGTTRLAALQQHLFEESAPAQAADDTTVTVRSWPGEARECVEIARAIRAEAARGVPFDRMAILLHAPRDYTPHLEEALARAAIPAFFASGTTQPDPSGRALLALLACKADNLSARRFGEYLSLAQVPEPEEQRLRAADPDRAWVPPEHDFLPPAVAELAAALAAGAREHEAPHDPLPLEPETTVSVAGTVRAPWRWEQLLVDAAVIGSKERWARRLRGLERELRLRRSTLADDDARAARADHEIADLLHLHAFALPVIDLLDALPERALWGEWMRHLRIVAAAALREPAHVLTTIAELEPMAPIGPVALDEVQLVLGERLRDLAVPPPRRRYGGVFVAPTSAARGLAFDVVFLPGLAERLFPRKIVEDPILLDASRRLLDAEPEARGDGDGDAPRVVHLVTQAGRVAAERLALRLAVGAAGARVAISYPRIDMEQARPRVPSFYTLEALRAAEGRLPGYDEMSSRARDDATARLGWPAPDEPADAIDEAEYDLATLKRLLDEGDSAATVGAARYLLTAGPHLGRALRARARRWWPKRWTSADGFVDPDELARAALGRHQLAVRSFSPTALQNFAACPYKFFLHAVHRLQPREEPTAIEAIDPLTRGALFHDVQYAVLTKLRADGALPVQPATLSAALAVVDGIVDVIAARYRDDLAPAIPRVWEDGINAIRADLREWLRRESESTDGWVPHRFELAFGLADRDRPNADPASVETPVAIEGGLMLRGAVDLVERHERGVLRVTDHKTGKVRARERVVVGGGEILQPMLYALACERLLPEPVEAGRLYYCTTVGGYQERVVPLDDQSRARAREVIATIDGWLREGFLPAAPEPGACDFCDYRLLCGPYEELRVKRKPAPRIADLQRLRELP